LFVFIVSEAIRQSGGFFFEGVGWGIRI